jgi:hypothetical protein
MDDDAVREPEVPEKYSWKLDEFAELLAVRVRRLLPVVGLGVNNAVTPLGRLDADSVTLPANPFLPVTVMTVEVEPPGSKVIGVGDAASVKLGGAVTVRESAIAEAKVPEVPVIVKL